MSQFTFFISIFQNPSNSDTDDAFATLDLHYFKLEQLPTIIIYKGDLEL